MSETTDKSTRHVILKKISFSYGPGMQKQWVEKNTKFLNQVGTKIVPSVTGSIESKELVLTKVDPDDLPMFKTEQEKIDHIATFSHW